MLRTRIKFIYVPLIIVANAIGGIWAYDDFLYWLIVSNAVVFAIIAFNEWLSRSFEKDSHAKQKAIQEFVSEQLGVAKDDITIIRMDESALVKVNRNIYQVIHGSRENYLVQAGTLVSQQSSDTQEPKPHV